MFQKVEKKKWNSEIFSQKQNIDSISESKSILSSFLKTISRSMPPKQMFNHQEYTSLEKIKSTKQSFSNKNIENAQGNNTEGVFSERPQNTQAFRCNKNGTELKVIENSEIELIKKNNDITYGTKLNSCLQRAINKDNVCINCENDISSNHILEERDDQQTNNVNENVFNIDTLDSEDESETEQEGEEEKEKSSNEEKTQMISMKNETDLNAPTLFTLNQKNLEIDKNQNQRRQFLGKRSGEEEQKLNQIQQKQAKQFIKLERSDLPLDQQEERDNEGVNKQLREAPVETKLIRIKEKTTEFTLKNESLAKEKESFKIKVILEEKLLESASSVVKIEMEDQSYLPFKCQFYRQSKQNPKQFSNITIPLKDGPVLLKESITGDMYQFMHFPKFEECLVIFQDTILQQWINSLNFEKTKSSPTKFQKDEDSQIKNLNCSRDLKNTLTNDHSKEIQLELFQKKENGDVFLLRSIEESVSIEDILLLSTLQQFQGITISEESLIGLAHSIFHQYYLFVEQGIALPMLSSQTISISISKQRIIFTPLYECYPSSQSESLKLKERKSITSILSSLFKRFCMQDSSQIEYEYTTFYKVISCFEENLFANDKSADSLNPFISSSILKLCYSALSQRYYQTPEENSNFLKCKQLTLLAALYESMFNYSDQLHILEELKQLQQRCYGINSLQHMKTLRQLLRIYYQNNNFSNLIPLLEKVSAYLREIKPVTAMVANDLYLIVKSKTRLTTSITAKEDFEILFNYLESHKEEEQNKTISFNSAKINFLYGSLLHDLNDIQTSVTFFKQAIQDCDSLSLQNLEQLKQNTSISKVKFFSESYLARSLYRLEDKEGALQIIETLESQKLKFACPVFFQLSGIFEYLQFQLTSQSNSSYNKSLQDTQLLQSYKFLHQAYVLRQRQLKRNTDYLQLLLYYSMVTAKIKGKNHANFLKLASEMKNFTGDFFNLDCLFTITQLLIDSSIFELALEKLNQAKQILNLIGVTSKADTPQYKEYKRKEVYFQQIIKKNNESRHM